LEQSLVFIHGFLGQPGDWQPVMKALGKGVTSFHFVDLNKDFKTSELNFQNWPDAFIRWTRHQNITTPMCLVGYSLGGRLLGPLLEKGFAQKAVFMSSQFGFADNDFEGRSQRRLFNQMWAQRFLEEPWESVTASWNQQDIFKNSLSEPHRAQEHFSRQTLAALLTGFSLSEQKDYSFLWQRKELKLLYLAGENDPKYKAQAEQIQSSSAHSFATIIKNSGHRVLLDQPQLVAREISDFITKTN
jgi:2-succinyl-6-hydroxy-2,4-cyclohexadiene-1-carboxylate synthase